MNSAVIPQTAWLAMLTELTTVAMLWAGAKLHLGKTNIPITGSTLIGDFTEADFTNYAASAAVTWATPGYTPGNVAVVTGDLKTFSTGASPTVFNTIYNWYLTDSAGTALLFARTLDTPIVLSGPLQLIEIIPSYVAILSQ
jgi:hypothetical protein